jgi:hypothetical protein
MKKTKTKYANKNAIQEDNTLSRSQMKLQKSNDNIFKTQKNLSKFNSSSTTNMMKNNKNINDKKNINNSNYSSKRYHTYLLKKNDYNDYNDDKTKREDISKSRDKFFKDNNKNLKDYKIEKNKTTVININNYDPKKTHKNLRYNLSKDKYSNNNSNNIIINNRKEKNFTPMKNRNPRFATHNRFNNRFNERKQIIKIQSVWRGHYLRKIIVGNVKKYISLVALFKYAEKIFDDNRKKLLKKAINILKDYISCKGIKYKFRRVIRRGNNDNDDNNDKKNNRRFRIFKNLTRDDSHDKDMFKKVYLFSNEDFDPMRNSFNINNGNNNNNNNKDKK